MSSLSEIYHKYYTTRKPLVKVIINLAIAAAAGVIFYTLLKQNYYVFAFYEKSVYLLTSLIINGSATLLNILGYDCHTFGKIISDTYGCSLNLDRGCVGRMVFLTFLAYIIATPASVRRKVIFSAVGCGVIVLLNILRVSMLVAVGHHCPEYFNFTHEYLFKYSLYAGVFLMWVVWTNKFRFSSSSF
ncbi:MAG: archaeosortase/exosortase family protein [Bacteroidales bacterium]|nr:archaeosortase/exosortase family protein [Bacteroidales bacterium]